MKTKFICPNHRVWLQGKISEAEKCWDDYFEKGKCYQLQHRWDESIPALGCAFDAATICVEKSIQIDSETVDRFSRSALCLTYSLLKVEQRDFAAQIVEGVQSTLERCGEQVLDRQSMLDALRKLHLLLAAHPARQSRVEGSWALQTQAGSIH